MPEGATVPSNVVLKTYQSREYLGLVWCCLEEPATALPDPEELRNVDGEWEAADRFPVKAGVLATTENFRDVAHFAFVHRRSMGRVPEVIEPLKVRREGTEVWMDRWYTAHGGGGGDVYESSGDILYAYHTIAPAFVCLIHHYRDRVGNFLMRELQHLLAEDLSGQKSLRLIGQLIFGKQRRSHGHAR